jgi:hypothetical protein
MIAQVVRGIDKTIDGSAVPGISSRLTASRKDRSVQQYQPDDARVKSFAR